VHLKGLVWRRVSCLLVNGVRWKGREFESWEGAYRRAALEGKVLGQLGSKQGKGGLFALLSNDVVSAAAVVTVSGIVLLEKLP